MQRETWLERDRAMIDTLKTVGIEKGKPFQPDAKTKPVLEPRPRESHAWLELPFAEGTHWALPAKAPVWLYCVRRRLTTARRTR